MVLEKMEVNKNEPQKLIQKEFHDANISGVPGYEKIIL